MVAFTGLRGFLNWGVFHYPVWFVFWLGYFPSPHIAWSDWTPRGVCVTGGLGDLRRSASPPLVRLLGSSLEIPDSRGSALHWESIMASLAARFCPPWFWQGVFCHPLWHTVAYIAARLLVAFLLSPFLRCRLFSSASLARFLNFRSSDRMRRSEVLLKSHLLLFHGQLSLVLLLLVFGRGE